MIPLVSSLCYGPMEICQLPRLWWKVQLRLPKRYLRQGSNA